MNGIIYKTTNLINGKIYVGQDSNNNSKYLGSGSIFKKSIKKYGKSNFIKEILCFCDLFDLDEAETFWIKTLNSTDRKIGYNICTIGKSCLGIKRSEETKEKLRKPKSEEHKKN